MTFYLTQRLTKSVLNKLNLVTINSTLKNYL